MQLRPTYLLWMQPDHKLPQQDRLIAEPFKGAEHIYLESAESWTQATDKELSQRILSVLGKTGDDLSGIAIVHVWNLAFANEQTFDECIFAANKVHEFLERFLELNSNLYPQLTNRLCQVVIRLPCVGQTISDTDQKLWISKLQEKKRPRLPIDRVILVGNSNTNPGDHEKGITVKEQEVDIHLIETTLALLESQVDVELKTDEFEGELPFWSAGSGRVVVDLRNAATYLAHVQGARLLQAQLRDDGKVQKVDVIQSELDDLKLAPTQVALHLLEGTDPGKSSCLKQLQRLQYPLADPNLLEEVGGADVPAIFITQAMIELSEHLGRAHDQMQQNRIDLAAQTAQVLFQQMHDYLQSGKLLYMVQARDWLEQIQDKNQRFKGEYPKIVDTLPQLKNLLSDTSKSTQIVDTLHENSAIQASQASSMPDPFGAYRDLRQRVRERRPTFSLVLRWGMGVFPLALAMFFLPQVFGINFFIAAGASLLIQLMGLSAGLIQSQHEKRARKKAFWHLRDSIQSYGRYRLKELMREQGFKYYDHLHALIGEPEETSSRKILDPEKAFGKHIRDQKMKAIIEMPLYLRLDAMKIRMCKLADELEKFHFSPIWPPNSWLFLYFDEDALRVFPFFPMKENEILSQTDLERVPNEEAQLTICLSAKMPDVSGPATLLWDTLDDQAYHSQWVEQVKTQGYQYFEKQPLDLFIEFLHAQRPEHTRKAEAFLNKAAYPYFRLAMSAPKYTDYHMISPSSEGIHNSAPIQLWIPEKSHELQWDGWSGFVRLTMEGPVYRDKMHVLPISSAQPTLAPSQIESGDVSLV